MKIQVNKEVQELLRNNNCEGLVKDLESMLKESGLEDNSYKIKLNLIEGDFNNNTAKLLVIDDKIILEKTYPFSKLNKSLELRYDNHNLLK